MKKLFFIFLSSSAFAALPPLAQSTRELQTLLSDPRVYQSLGSAEIIQNITRTETGYLIVTQHYALPVDIKYGEGDRKIIGPQEFEFEFQEPRRSLKNSRK